MSSPRYSIESASVIAWEVFGVRGDVSALPSERDQNFLLVSQSRQRLVLKISNSLEDADLLKAQNALLRHLETRVSFCQRVIESVAGEDLVQVSGSTFATESQHYVRLVTFLDGIPLAEVISRPRELLRDLGRKLAQLDKALTSFDHPAIHRDFYWDLAKGLRIINDYARLIAARQLRELVERCAVRFERTASPSLVNLRRSIIHGDANDYNILVNNKNNISGLIDFGDVVYTYTIADLAVALAYIVLDKRKPLANAVEVVRAYHREYPLHEDEIEVLFGLVVLRLCMSICLAAHQQREQPDNTYLSISQRSIANSLPELAAVDWRQAADTFRRACQLD